MGGGTNTTQTSTTLLSPEQQKLLDLAIPPATQYAANPTTLPSTPLTAGFDPAQTAGQNQALSAAENQNALAASGANASDFLLNSVLYPETNPALQGTIDAATRPIQQNLVESTLPALRSGAALSGNFGSSRQGIAEGLASGRASTAIGDTAAGVANTGYQSGLDAMVKALGLLPQTQGAQTTGALTTSGVGDVRQGQAQSQLDESAYRSLFSQMEPLYRAQNLGAILTGLPGGSTQSTGSTSSSGIGPTLSSILGIGSLIGGLGPLLALL